MELNGKVIEKLRRASPEVKSILGDTMKEASTLVMEKSIREAPGSTGKLRQSIRRELDGDGMRAEIFPSVRYGEDLHGPFEGGGTHSSPYLIPSKEAKKGGDLYRWGIKHGVNPWAVRGSIAKKGVKYNKYLKRASTESEAKVKQIFAQGVQRIIKFIAD